METSVVTIKGQIVIPVKLRRITGIKRGTRVYLEERGGDIIVHPATPAFYERMCGILKGGGAVEAFLQSRRKDTEREEGKIARR